MHSTSLFYIRFASVEWNISCIWKSLWFNQYITFFITEHFKFISILSFKYAMKYAKGYVKIEFFGPHLVLKWTRLPLTDHCIDFEKGSLHFTFTEIICPPTGPGNLKFITDSLLLFGLKETFLIAQSKASVMWGDAMPHEMNKFTQKVSSPRLKKQHRLCNKIYNVWQGLFVYLQSIKATRACLGLAYSCNCRQSQIQSSPKAGTRLYITGLFATIVGNVSNLQRFIIYSEKQLKDIKIPPNL